MIIQFVGHILNKKRSKMITKKHTKGGKRCITTLYNFSLEDSTEDYSNRKKIQW